MLRTTIARLLACCTLALACQLHAQSPDAVPVRELDLSLGIAHSDRLDGAVSPSRFGGDGIDVTLGVANTIGHAIVAGSIRYGSRSLAPADAALLGERLNEGELHVGLFPEPHANDFLALGIDAQATVAVATHRYADGDPQKSYLFATAMVGPTVLARHEVGSRRLTAQITLPLGGIVAQPYSALWSERSALGVRPVTLASLQDPSTVISWTSSARQRPGIMVQYRLGLLRYSGVLPVRGLSQSIAVGFTR